MATNMNQFMTDEYVLAYHGPLLYEARVSYPRSIVNLSGSFVQSLVLGGGISMGGWVDIG